MALCCQVKGEEKQTCDLSITTVANSMSWCLLWNPFSAPLRGQRGGWAIAPPSPPTAADDITSHLSCIPISPIRVQETTGAEPGHPDQTRSQVCSKAGSLKCQYHSVSHQKGHLANLLDLPLISCHKESTERISKRWGWVDCSQMSNISWTSLAPQLVALQRGVGKATPQLEKALKAFDADFFFLYVKTPAAYFFLIHAAYWSLKAANHYRTHWNTDKKKKNDERD